ncbi:MAG: HIT family protein, partial [Planctomycetes bacterium]|nr:HIT family protein [Planctomycetota bacterium]
MDCVFCGIVAGERPASFVHRDERVIAFADLHPVNPGHLLVVPRVHAAGLA